MRLFKITPVWFKLEVGHARDIDSPNLLLNTVAPGAEVEGWEVEEIHQRHLVICHTFYLCSPLPGVVSHQLEEVGYQRVGF